MVGAKTQGMSLINTTTGHLAALSFSSLLFLVESGSMENEEEENGFGIPACKTGLPYATLNKVCLSTNPL
jgi:hypothetical protein